MSCQSPDTLEAGAAKTKYMEGLSRGCAKEAGGSDLQFLSCLRDNWS